MAEIRVEPRRRSLAWLWILIVLIVIAAVCWYLYRHAYFGTRADGGTHSSAAVAVARALAALWVAT